MKILSTAKYAERSFDLLCNMTNKCSLYKNGECVMYERLGSCKYGKWEETEESKNSSLPKYNPHKYYGEIEYSPSLKQVDRIAVLIFICFIIGQIMRIFKAKK